MGWSTEFVATRKTGLVAGYFWLSITPKPADNIGELDIVCAVHLAFPCRVEFEKLKS